MLFTENFFNFGLVEQTQLLYVSSHICLCNIQIICKINTYILYIEECQTYLIVKIILEIYDLLLELFDKSLFYKHEMFVSTIFENIHLTTKIV